MALVEPTASRPLMKPSPKQPHVFLSHRRKATTPAITPKKIDSVPSSGKRLNTACRVLSTGDAASFGAHHAARRWQTIGSALSANNVTTSGVIAALNPGLSFDSV